MGGSMRAVILMLSPDDHDYYNSTYCMYAYVMHVYNYTVCILSYM